MMIVPWNLPSSSCFWRLVALLTIGVVGLSCSGDDRARETLDWRTALERLDQTDTQLFSFSYVAPPPEGSIFHITVLDPDDINGLDSDESATCSLFDATSTKPRDPDFWYLKIKLSSTTPGSYTIVPDIDEHAVSQASVRLTHVQSWERKGAAFDAVSGTVELQEAPQNGEDWSAGMMLHATVDAEFPVNPLRRLGCHAEGSTDGSEVFRECTCEDMDGNKTTCVPEVGENDCCYAVGGETFSYQLQLTAEPCAAMCRAASDDLFRFCEELR